MRYETRVFELYRQTYSTSYGVKHVCVLYNYLIPCFNSRSRYFSHISFNELSYPGYL